MQQTAAPSPIKTFGMVTRVGTFGQLRSLNETAIATVAALAISWPE
ncbi:MAG: hypothetical protein JKY12_07670 [Sneathiella sp.]|nr:hypothetical protein [Sneathiella sp.]